MPFSLGPWELIIVLLIVVVIFGAGKISEIGGALGKGIREFRSATSEEDAAGRLPATSAVAPGAGTTTTITTAAPSEVKCPSCGTMNPPTQAFCGQCGTRISKAA